MTLHGEFTVTPARAEDRAAALRLFFQHAEPAEREERVERALTLVAAGELPADGLFACRTGQTVVGAMAILPLAGATALVWPPQVVAGPQQHVIESRLVAAACDALRLGGCKFAQAMLTDSETPYVGPLLRHGFTNITTLVYLQKDLRTEDHRNGEPTRLTYEVYPQTDTELFHQTLLQSYEGTGDCPELNDLRTIDEILASYRAVPGCRLERWWLARENGTAVGVLILIQLEESPTWELSYLGLVPAARGRGLGTELTRNAVAEARRGAAGRMTLTVDARNGPAARVYAAQGFEEFERREVYLTVFGQTG
jgi:ribosomal protein S18 acetylase RimI-like enzyme